MHRRKFFKVLSGVTTAIVTSRVWPKSLAAGAEATEDYAHFCALPESDRVFSIVSKDRIVTEHLDPATWEPNTYDAPAKLPGIPDSWMAFPCSRQYPV